MVVVDKTVVITGASSGIGRACVQRLIDAGWHVFASVRQSTDGASLQSEFGSRLTPVIMDVSNRLTVMSAAEQVSFQLQGRGLDGLVNVAGIGMVRPVEYATADDLHEIFDINVFGQIAVIQAFLPLLRQARGRVVNISSIGVHIGLPFGGLLGGSKAAFGLMSDALRLELHPFGVHVSIVEPGAIKTPAVEKTLGNVEGVVADLPPGGAEYYGAMIKKFAQLGYEHEMAGSAPDVVAQSVYHALTARRPKIRYRVGKHAKILAALPRILPDRLLDAVLLRIAGMPTEFGSVASKENREALQHAA
jgi:NAD(P)-dependent dehydrogenase (short-subunit alcohol dehydrogenase family)